MCDTVFSFESSTPILFGNLAFPDSPWSSLALVKEKLNFSVFFFVFFFLGGGGGGGGGLNSQLHNFVYALPSFDFLGLSRSS